jgi:hypothetical protein
VTRDFEFDFDPRFKAMLLLLGASPARSEVRLTDDGRLTARFGFVSLDTPVSNITSVEKTGPYRWWTAIGVRTSLADRGLTFGSTTAGGVCLRFREPVAAKPRFGPIRHPGLTLTMEDPDGFIEALGLSGGPG